MPTLYDLTQELAAIHEALVANEGELTPELAERLERFDFAERDKIDAYYAVIEGLEAEKTRFQAEAQRLRTVAAAAAKSIVHMEERLHRHMRQAGKTELRGDFKTVKIVKNGGPAPLDVLVPEPSLPDEFVVKTANRAMLRAALQQSEDGFVRWEGIPLATLGERGTSLRWS